MTIVIEDHKLKVAAAKRKASEWMPYLHSFFGPMRCIATDKCPRAAVDKYGRMYYNPAYVMTLKTEVLAYIILHETLHIVLSHHERTAKLIPTPDAHKSYVSNVAQDLCIQQTLAREIGTFEPANIVRYEDMKHIPGVFANRTSEQYFECLLQYYEEQRQKPKPPPPPKPPVDTDEDEEEDEDYEDEYSEDEYSDDDDEDYEDEDGDGEGQDTDEDGEDAEGESGTGGESATGGQPGDTDGSEGSGADQQPSDSGQSDGSGPKADGTPQSGNGGGDGSGEPQDNRTDGDPVDHSVFPDFGDVCNPADAGSNSDGLTKEWEEEPSIADIANSEHRLREVEKALDRLDPCIGSGAGNIRQSLKARLHPMPDPFDQLKTVVAKSIASPIGSPEQTYRKWPRRQLPGKCRLRGIERRTPEAVILLDTSGSMLDSEVQARALAIVAKGISRLQNPRIVCCDGAIQSAKRVANMSNFQWDGGGGTDMAAGLLYVDQKYKPDSIVIITDGITGWPLKPLKARVICALCRDSWASRVPHWIKTVHLYRRPSSYAL